MSATVGQASIADLLRRIRVLELAARKNAASLLAGDYVTSIPGSGLLFEELRKYVPGEPARRIDWNVTARLGEPFVKVHLEERQREVVVAVDVSPSMHSGFQQKTKLEYAVELAATLVASAIDAGDRVGHVLFADRVLDESRPRGGRRQLFVVLRSLLEHTAPWTRPVRESDPRGAIHAVQRRRGRRVVLFLISDFLDHDVPEDLKYAQARHDLSLLHVYDPLEYATERAVVFPGFSPEREAAAAPVRPGETGGLEEMQRFLRRECAPHRIATASFSTARPVPSALGEFFHQRRRRRH